MIRRSTAVVLIVFIALLIMAFFLNQSGWVLQSDPTPSLVVPVGFFGVDSASGVKSITIEKGAGQSITYTLAGQNEWVLSGPSAGQVDNARVSAVLAAFGELDTLAELSAPPPDSATGLDDPAYKISVTFGSGNVRLVAVGKLVPTGTGYYVRIEGESPKVVSNYALEDVFSLLNEPPVTAPAPNTNS